MGRSFRLLLLTGQVDKRPHQLCQCERVPIWDQRLDWCTAGQRGRKLSVSRELQLRRILRCCDGDARRKWRRKTGDLLDLVQSLTGDRRSDAVELLKVLETILGRIRAPEGQVLLPFPRLPLPVLVRIPRPFPFLVFEDKLLRAASLLRTRVPNQPTRNANGRPSAWRSDSAS